MGAGRPRKPNHVKAAQGTLQPCRINNNPLTYEPLSVAPKPPKDLSEDGRNYYTYVCTLMITKKLLTPAFLFDIERSSFWYQEFKKAQREINENGTFEISQTGWKQISASITIAEKATKLLNEFENKYGLNLIASQKIEMPAPEEDDDLMKALKGFSNGL